MQQTTVSKKFYIPGIKIPCKLLKDGFTPRMAILGGLFYTYSGKREKDGTVSTCTRRRSELKSYFRLSDSTLWRGLKKLKNGYMSKVENKDDTYIFDRSTTNGELFLRTPEELIKKIFTIKYKAKENRPERIEMRYLTHNEIVVGSYVITQCDNLNKQKKEFTSSNSEIAEVLGLSEPIVQSALNTLIAAKIVFCKFKGINRHKKSIYHVHRRFIREKKQTEQKQDVIPTDSNNSKTFKSQDDIRREKKAAEEREYYGRKNLAEDIADRNYKKAMKDKFFADAEREIKNLAPDLAFAEVLNSPELPSMQESMSKWQQQRSMALKRLRLTDDDFDVEKIMESVGEQNN